MRKAKRGFGSGRIVATLMMGSLAIALAGCGGTDGSSSAGTTPTSPFASADSGATDKSASSSPAPSSSPTTSAASPTSTGSSGSSSSGTSAPPPTATASSSTVTLAWQPPTQNTDGSPITDLAGYKIHYGTASAAYSQTVAVNNAGLTRYVVDNLAGGTYYFAISAYNSKGLESDLSAEVSTRVN